MTGTTGGTFISNTTYTGLSGTGIKIEARSALAVEVFSHWVIVGGGRGFFENPNNPNTTFIMQSNVSPNNLNIEAVFAPRPRTLTIINPSGVKSANYNDEDRIPIVADMAPAGKIFKEWIIRNGGGAFDNDKAMGTIFTMPGANVTIEATYDQRPHTLTILNLSGVVKEDYNAGTVIPIAADAAPTGMVFDKWVIMSGGGSFANAKAMGTNFTMPNENTVIVAAYKDATEAPPSSDGGRTDRSPHEPTSPKKPGDVSHILNTEDHMAYVVGVGHDLFAPDKEMTRAEVAQMFYNLLLNKSIGITLSFPDVPKDAWYAKAVNTLASIGVITGRPNGRYYPTSPVTRAEFVTIAVRFTKETLGKNQASHFADVPETHWAHDSIVTATSYGWIQGVGNDFFAPDRHMTRAEVVTMTNRMLLRTADRVFVDDNPRLIFFTDVPQTYWAYYDIAEASIAHEYIRHEDGSEEWALPRPPTT